MPRPGWETCNLQRTFNPPFATVRVFWNGIEAGHAYLTIRGAIADIGDFRVADDAAAGTSWWRDLLQRPKRINFRGYGIGTALMEETCRYAQSLGAKAIEGRLSGEDARQAPWYVACGFGIDADGIARRTLKIGSGDA